MAPRTRSPPWSAARTAPPRWSPPPTPATATHRPTPTPGPGTAAAPVPRVGAAPRWAVLRAGRPAQKRGALHPVRTPTGSNGHPAGTTRPRVRPARALTRMRCSRAMSRPPPLRTYPGKGEWIRHPRRTPAPHPSSPRRTRRVRVRSRRRFRPRRQLPLGAVGSRAPRRPARRAVPVTGLRHRLRHPVQPVVHQPRSPPPTRQPATVVAEVGVALRVGRARQTLRRPPQCERHPPQRGR